MKRLDFNDSWRVEQPGSFFENFASPEAASVFRAPRDEMISQERNPNSVNGPDSAWYDGKTYTFTKTFFAPAEWRGKWVELEFEGVMENAAVFVNGQFAGKCPYGYSGFSLPIHTLLDWGGENLVKVVASAGMQQTSRWYSGGGLYRPVWLWVGEPVRLNRDGLRVETRSIGQTAAIAVTATLTSAESTRERRTLQLTVTDPKGAVVARDSQPVTLFGSETVTLRSQMDIPSPALWSVEQPNLYRLHAQLLDDGEVVEEEGVTFGIRTLEVTRTQGMKINGHPVKLRGAAIHHDNGVLGAITLKDAEVRRVKKLKAAGFNAIRSAHNPASRWLLEACDEVGMLVMDELFDVWNQSKRDHDYSLFFQEHWREDMVGIVAKDYNHPSVVLYTVGNEIPETGTPQGASRNREMAGALRELDSTRPVVNCINGMFSVMPRMREILADIVGDPQQVPGDINALMTMFDANLDEVMRHQVVTDATEETFAGVDVCGYNYMHARYLSDGERYPNRIIVGSETNPDKIGYNWPVITSLNYVLGDFCWTGWDYIGEAGVGKNDYEMTFQMYGPWPWYLAYCGDHDICGNRRPQSFYREIVFGLREAPYLCVERPEHYNQPKYTTNWTWPDVVESWTWPGFEGKPTHVEVYSDGDRVELLLNGVSLGSAPVGEEMPNKALFDVTYQPGVLTAVSYRKGVETGRMTLETVGKACRMELNAEAEVMPAEPDRLFYVNLFLADEKGRWNPSREAEVTVSVTGPVTVAGYGSADPRSLEKFNQPSHLTFDGRGLLVLRTTGEAGEIRVTASGAGLEPAELVLTAGE